MNRFDHILTLTHSITFGNSSSNFLSCFHLKIFLAYNAAKTLEKFYRDFPKNLVDEIILVDDASKDQTYTLAKKTRDPLIS